MSCFGWLVFWKHDDGITILSNSKISFSTNESVPLASLYFTFSATCINDTTHFEIQILAAIFTIGRREPWKNYAAHSVANEDVQFTTYTSQLT